jgi:hypothetical protein
MILTWPQVVAALGGQAIFLVAAGWLIRRLVSHGMDRDLAKFRAELKAEADRDIERLRNELRFDIEKHKNTLRMAEVEHRVKFSRLHEKRAEVIAKIYDLMVEADWVAQSFIKGDVKSQTRANAATEKVIELARFFESHRLYLPNSDCVILDGFINKLFHAINAIKIYWTDTEHPNAQMTRDRNEKMLEVLKALDNEIPGIKSLLETEFRKLLGAIEEEWLIRADSIQPIWPDEKSRPN